MRQSKLVLMRIMSFFVILLLIFTIAYSAYLPYHKIGVEWCAILTKPAILLPDWMCGIGWLCSYLLMTTAVWIIWKNREEKNIASTLGVFVLQFLVNVSWGPLVVRSQNLNLAMIYMCVLFCLVIWNMIVFWNVSKKAGLLFIPYLMWVIYNLWTQTLLFQQNS